MAFKAGAIYGEAILDTKKWDGGIKRITAGAGIAVAAIGAAFVAAMIKAVKKADEFQKAMSNVATVIDTSKISTKALQRELLKLDPALGDTTELTNGLYQAFSAGAKDAKEAMDITATAAMFGKAALTDTNTAVDVLTTAISAYGRESMDAEKAADIFFTTIKQGKITGDELSATIGQSIPLFASVGIELEELTSAMAAMTKMGVSANETTTQLNGIVNAFLKPSEDMAGRLKDIGYESGSAFLKAKGLTGALEFMEDATRGDAAEIAKLTPNIRAMRGIMALTGEGAIEFNNILGEMEGAAGAATEAFEKQEKTIDAFNSALGKLELIAGDAVLNGMKPLVRWLTGVMQAAISAHIQLELVNEALAGAAPRDDIDQMKDTIAALEAQYESYVKKGWWAWGGNLKAKEAALAAIQNEIDAINEVIKWTEKARLAVAQSDQEARRENERQAAAAEIVLAQLREEQKQMERLRDAYAGTDEGQRELLESTITYFETWKDMGPRTKEMVDDVLESLRAQRPVIEDVETAIEKTRTKWQANVEQMREDWETNFGGIFATFEDYTIAITTANKGMVETIVEDTEDAAEELKTVWSDYADGMISIASYMTDSISNITNLYHQNQLDQVTLATQAELDTLQAAWDAELVGIEAGSEAEKAINAKYEAEKLEIEKTARDKKNEIEENAFNAEKATAIAGVWINAATAIMGWWASLAPLGPVGMALAAIMTVITLGVAGVQTALIASQQFVPSKQEGGMAGGMTRVNEAGGEIIQLPDQSLVIPHDISRQIAAGAGGQGTVINVSFAGAQIADTMDLDRVTNHVIRKIGKQMRLAV